MLSNILAKYLLATKPIKARRSSSGEIVIGKIIIVLFARIE